MQMLYLPYLTIADVQSRNGVELLELILLEEGSDLEDFIIEGVDEEFILLFLEYLPSLRLLHQLSEQKGVRSNLTVLHQCPADRTGDWLVEADLKHAVDADITEEVNVGAGQHWPSTEDVIRLEADVTCFSSGAFPQD
jgi:hypothetical protein